MGLQRLERRPLVRPRPPDRLVFHAPSSRQVPWPSI
jgi:hypothetical protein